MKPIGIEAVNGATVMELNVAAVTVKVAEPDLPPDVAVIVAVPADTPVASPGDTTVATAMGSEVHVTVLLMLALVPSEKLPVATKVCVPPICTVGAKGATVMELNVAAVTVKVAEPALAPDVAVIVAVPADWPVATPGYTTVATASGSEVHVTVLLMLSLVPSEK